LSYNFHDYPLSLDHDHRTDVRVFSALAQGSAGMSASL
jgi:hypothetical protein